MKNRINICAPGHYYGLGETGTFTIFGPRKEKVNNEL